MIDPTTGMKTGERYCVENVERAHQFPGFFLDGKYYLGPELLTAVGWLEGKRFIYDNLDAAGEPIFPDRVAGDIEDLTLTLVDGTALKLCRVDVSAMTEKNQAGHPQHADTALNRNPNTAEPAANLRAPASGPQSLDGSWISRRDKAPLLLSAAVIGFLAGFIITHAQRRHR
ncbi:hypothetical protein DV532_15920 [Pseudomonas sp. Leaf58]|nr:hypothetical protein DV532_15920 [Pseudomonas sp. Leaf58]KQN58905.1 hypothetical protein ASF02_18685 [Pseudomonas sp. Leaf58]